ncbi:hypothetical protein Pyrfu_0518 [Pyrolobus fumarii 1A]|uniref:Uncharacterized protein n=1 Tax=Pyrolobus fumarii (strain DSM 11204 / 1A) TaxID=694429 RepID=G0EGL5_PYRF1|nr:hypothetical protein [Pyrolobus fumarii]AEM38389.1 hypothetical protein Pyrfu_0518 [Pyrolobus fumarii 1A]
MGVRRLRLEELRRVWEGVGASAAPSLDEREAVECNLYGGLSRVTRLGLALLDAGEAWRLVELETPEGIDYIESPEETVAAYLRGWKYWGSLEDRDKRVYDCGGLGPEREEPRSKHEAVTCSDRVGGESRLSSSSWGVLAVSAIWLL